MQESAGRLAERVVEGLDDTGREERVVIWIERRPGALWTVGRAVNPQLRPSPEPRAEDYVWQGYELEDDRVVSEADGGEARTKPFRREELLAPLERLFFGRT